MTLSMSILKPIVWILIGASSLIPPKRPTWDFKKAHLSTGTKEADLIWSYHIRVSQWKAYHLEMVVGLNLRIIRHHLIYLDWQLIKSMIITNMTLQILQSWISRGRAWCKAQEEEVQGINSLLNEMHKISLIERGIPASIMMPKTNFQISIIITNPKQVRTVIASRRRNMGAALKDPITLLMLL